MALNLIKEMSTGVQVTYWKIASMELNYRRTNRFSNQDVENFPMTVIQPDENAGQIDVVIYGYLNAEIRGLNKLPVTAEVFSINVPSEIDTLGDLRQFLYDEIKKIKGWETSKDI